MRIGLVCLISILLIGCGNEQIDGQPVASREPILCRYSSYEVNMVLVNHAIIDGYPTPIYTSIPTQVTVQVCR